MEHKAEKYCRLWAAWSGFAVNILSGRNGIALTCFAAASVRQGAHDDTGLAIDGSVFGHDDHVVV